MIGSMMTSQTLATVTSSARGERRRPPGCRSGSTPARGRAGLRTRRCRGTRPRTGRGWTCATSATALSWWQHRRVADAGTEPAWSAVPVSEHRLPGMPGSPIVRPLAAELVRDLTASAPEPFPVIAPFTGEVLHDLPISTVEDVDRGRGGGARRPDRLVGGRIHLPQGDPAPRPRPARRAPRATARRRADRDRQDPRPGIRGGLQRGGGDPLRRSLGQAGARRRITPRRHPARHPRPHAVHAQGRHRGHHALELPAQPRGDGHRPRPRGRQRHRAEGRQPGRSVDPRRPPRVPRRRRPRRAVGRRHRRRPDHRRRGRRRRATTSASPDRPRPDAPSPSAPPDA